MLNVLEFFFFRAAFPRYKLNVIVILAKNDEKLINTKVILIYYRMILCNKIIIGSNSKGRIIGRLKLGCDTYSNDNVFGGGRGCLNLV